MILCTLRGYSDPEGELEGGEIVCAIERSEDGYHLPLEHNGEIQLQENHGRLRRRAGRRRCLKESLQAGVDRADVIQK
jgi:hypothetical protein